MASVFGRVRAVLSRHPMLSNVTAFTSLYAGADLSQQTIAGVDKYDFSSTARMVIIAAGIFGPTYYVWYRKLDQWLPGTAKKVIVQKIILDQGLIGAIAGVVFFGANSALEGKDRGTVVADVKERWPKAYFTGWVYWPAVQVINFTFLPTALRTVYVGSCSFVWTNFMCYLKSSKTQKDLTEAEEEQKETSNIQSN